MNYAVHLTNGEIISFCADDVRCENPVIIFFYKSKMAATFMVHAVSYFVQEKGSSAITEDINDFLSKREFEGIENIKQLRQRFNLTLKSAKAIHDCRIATRENIEFY